LGATSAHSVEYFPIDEKTASIILPTKENNRNEYFGEIRGKLCFDGISKRVLWALCYFG